MSKLSKLRDNLRAKSVPEINQEIIDLQKSYFILRMQKGTQQLNNFNLLKQVRRNIACAKTILLEQINNNKTL